MSEKPRVIPSEYNLRKKVKTAVIQDVTNKNTQGHLGSFTSTANFSAL